MGVLGVIGVVLGIFAVFAIGYGVLWILAKAMSDCVD